MVPQTNCSMDSRKDCSYWIIFCQWGWGFPCLAQLIWLDPVPTSAVISAVNILLGASDLAKGCREALLPICLGLLSNSLFRTPGTEYSCQTLPPVLLPSSAPFKDSPLWLLLIPLGQESDSSAELQIQLFDALCIFRDHLFLSCP